MPKRYNIGKGQIKPETVFVMTLFDIFLNNLGNSLIKLAIELKLERSANINVSEDI